MKPLSLSDFFFSLECERTFIIKYSNKGRCYIKYTIKVDVKLSIAIKVDVTLSIAVKVDVTLSIAVKVDVTLSIAVKVDVTLSIAVKVDVTLSIAIKVDVTLSIAVKVDVTGLEYVLFCMRVRAPFRPEVLHAAAVTGLSTLVRHASGLGQFRGTKSQQESIHGPHSV